MQSLAGTALTWAFQRWNNAYPWPHLAKVVDIALVAPFPVANITTTVGSASATVLAAETNASSIAAGDIITASDSNVVQRDTRVLTVTGTTTLTITLSRAALTSGTTSTITFGRQDYTLTDTASDSIKWVYDCRLTNSPRPLVYLDQRSYDIVRPLNEPAVPTHYTLFVLGSDAKIRFLPTPSQTGTVVLRYSRRMDDTATPLDIPMDWELGLIATAKWLFLLDKGGNTDRMEGWAAIAQNEMERQIANYTFPTPDQQANFQAAVPVDMWAWNPADTKGALAIW